MIHKLGYEWKNIYRLLTLSDASSTGEVTLSQFEKACIKQKVSLSDYETKKLYQTYGADKSDAQYINYRQMSINLGLHKESYNYLQKV